MFKFNPYVDIFKRKKKKKEFEILPFYLAREILELFKNSKLDIIVNSIEV